MPYALSKKHNIVTVKESDEPLIVEINKKALYNVFQNLVSNAIDYSPENTTVKVSTEKAGNFIKVSVLNQGPTIPKGDQPKLFQRFYRAEDAKKNEGRRNGAGIIYCKNYY